MRITVLLLLASLLQTIAGETYSQTTRLSLDISGAKLEAVLDAIEDNSEFYFLYNQRLIDVDREVSLSVNNQRIDKILDQLFAGEDVVYTVTDRKIILAPSFLSEIQQPQSTVSGTVTDESGEPLPGVTVVLKGTTRGTVTNANGEYSLTDISEDATLQFSFVGMKTREVEVGEQSTVDVTMVTDAIGIEEVVAVGYGTMRKSDLTGSVVRADIEIFEDQPNVSIMQSLQGTVPGLNVGAVNSAGDSPGISIRGRNTFSGATNPLIVLDGIIYNGNITDLNTEDIESIDILKDASSKAIYGSQAANGVLLITTKSGQKVRDPEFTYSSYYSMQTPSNILTPMRRDDYIRKTKDAWYQEAFLPPDYTEENPDFNVANSYRDVKTREGYLNDTDEDWLDHVTQTGSILKQNLSMAGATEKLNYYLSGGFIDQKGYIINDEYNRLSLRANFDSQVTNWLKIGFQSFITSSDYSGRVPNLRGVYNLPPLSALYDEDGEMVEYPHGSIRNPLYSNLIDNFDKRLNLFGNFSAIVDLPYIEGLTYKINYSTNYRTTRQYNFDKFAKNNKGAASKNNGVGQDQTIDNIINYSNTLAEKHKVDFTGLYGYQKRWGDGTNASAAIFLNDVLGYHSLESGEVDQRGVSSSAYDEYAIYQMGRINYVYDSKYLFTGTLRRDGFSGFGSNKKFGVFPSVALAWVASEEDFLREALPGLSYFKLRASYGQSGNRTIGRYGTLAKVATGYTYVFGNSSALGQWINNLPNNDLGWEETTGLNLGVDFAVLDGRINGNLDYYNDKTENILFNVNLPSLTGFGSVLSNIGKIDNNGVEISINTINVKRNHFQWNSTFNFSKNNNKIVSILGIDDDGDGKEDDLIANSLFIGEAMGAIYSYQIDGLYQLTDTDIPNGYHPGNYKMVDLDGPDGEPDGKIDPLHDRTIIGYTEPAYRFSINNQLSYKKWTLNFFINSIQGGKNGYYGNITPSNQGAWSAGNLRENGINAVKEWDYWTPTNTDAFFQGITTRGAISPPHYQQRSFIRLQDVTLSYKLDGAFSNKLGIKEIDLNLSGKNLATITKWKGTDPELGLGMGAGHMPLQKSYSLGLNVIF